MRDVRGQVDKLRAVFAHFSTESIKQAFEHQTKVILELQRSLNLMQERVKELETRPVVQKQAAPAHSMVLQEVSKVAGIPAKAKKDDSKSIYDFPEGQVRITKVEIPSGHLLGRCPAGVRRTSHSSLARHAMVAEDIAAS